MASELNCETCGFPVPADTGVCPRDGTVALASFHVPPPVPVSPVADEPKVVVQSTLEALTDVPKDPLIGLKLGEYELRARIGVGGMGLVYEGIQPLIGKRVAVKVLRPELAHSNEQVERLLAEARAVNAIRHRGIIDIFGFGQVPDGRQYIVMEYLDGQPLDAVLSEKNRLPVLEALPILDEVLAALASAHGAGVVHRDLKPSNIFLVRQPDGSRYVKVLDFGLAKRGQGPTGRTAQTRTDMVVGTPEYMAPEQARGQEVGPMTDLYALGVVTFEMVTGRLPFVGSSPVDLLMKHVEARPPRPSEFVSDLPPALDAFILQMLTKDPETRPNSADALRQQLHKLRRSLRSTRSNPSALAPTHEKPPPADDSASRRPTTPVAVPPLEQQASPTPSPIRKYVPVAVALGASVALLAGAAAIVFQEPARAVSLTPAPREELPPAHVRAAPPAPPDSEAPSKPGGSGPAEAAPVAEDKVEPAAPGMGRALAATAPSAKAPPPPPSETASPLPRAGRPAGTSKPSASTDAMSRGRLLKRINSLEESMPEFISQGRVKSPDIALNMLTKYRRELAENEDGETRRKIQEALDYMENSYIKKP
ncbi:MULTISPECIES: serine/threonine-protein kinase [Myxococcus]|uniref:serine/threonine-protein kinase n=1 Tax=Myxococcus TaxID=32 RepID=UPI0013D6156D|nr:MULTISPECIES: serine/threonine-protein kinase [Myxococcus]NVJ28479.1 protein kinase [Myxococcus sp. AM011]